MKFLLSKPIEQTLTDGWQKIDPAYRIAFFFIFIVNLLAFGFEMTNLTIHHDDVWQILIQDEILGTYLGRFVAAWLHYYVQDSHIMPFLQMTEGIILMAAYGILICRLWGVRKVLDVVILSAILCVFPYMAHVYQYNSTMAIYPIAHLLSAAAVLLSVRGTILNVAAAALLYLIAFAIYQSVIANAATVFGFWALTRLLFAEETEGFFSRQMVRSTLAALVAVVAGGLVYVWAVSLMDIPLDAYQGVDEAFSLTEGLNLSYGLKEIAAGTRSFYFWPENYFPGYLKQPHLILIAAAGILCIWLPKQPTRKIAAVIILGLSLVAPRLLQLIHPAGHYHQLTLTAYAIVIAGCVMLIMRAGNVLTRNLSTVLAAFLIAGYIVQCNWISTVNLLNTQAHYSTLTQILSRIRSLPDTNWDGKKAVVFGSYKMWAGYPFKHATGVATDFMDAKHMQDLARLVRDGITFLPANQATPGAIKFAAEHPIWPHPDSVGVVDGMAVVVLSKESAKPDTK
ncbi:MAG: glucosyltransferase domain-containing protein [Thiobacillus sp.]|nr:glucosyltransferase domain-containing protein [Thiobacillus sp.]